MPFNYKDLTYIRVALQAYEAQLMDVDPDDCTEDEYSEVQDDIQYLSRLMALTDREIDGWESKDPSLNLVKE